MIDGKELRTKKGKNGWAAWIPTSEDEMCKYQELTLNPGDARDCVDDEVTVGWQL